MVEVAEVSLSNIPRNKATLLSPTATGCQLEHLLPPAPQLIKISILPLFLLYHSTCKNFKKIGATSHPNALVANLETREIKWKLKVEIIKKVMMIR